jgi:hypothetical protein
MRGSNSAGVSRRYCVFPDHGDQLSVTLAPISVQVAQKLVKNFTDMHDEAIPRVPYA